MTLFHKQKAPIEKGVCTVPMIMQLEALECPMKAVVQINIAIDELFSNIAYYAYNPDIGFATVRFPEATPKRVPVSPFSPAPSIIAAA